MSLSARGDPAVHVRDNHAYLRSRRCGREQQKTKQKGSCLARLSTQVYTHDKYIDILAFLLFFIIFKGVQFWPCRMGIRVFLSNSSPADEMHALFPTPLCPHGRRGAASRVYSPLFSEFRGGRAAAWCAGRGSFFRSTFLAQDRSALFFFSNSRSLRAVEPTGKCSCRYVVLGRVRVTEMTCLPLSMAQVER